MYVENIYQDNTEQFIRHQISKPRVVGSNPSGRAIIVFFVYIFLKNFLDAILTNSTLRLNFS